MDWIEDDNFAGWSCSHCSWAVSAIQLDTTVAALAFNRSAQQGFEKHECLPMPQNPKFEHHFAGSRMFPNNTQNS